VLLALAAPWVISIPFSHVGNGMFRDTDVFAAPAAAATLLAAWLVGEMLRGGGSTRAPVAAAIVLAAAMPVVQWLAINTNVERGLGRVEALMAEPPRRNDTKRVYTFDFLGVRWNQLERYENSAAAFRRAVELAPSPTMLQKLALAEDLAGNPRGAIDAYHRLVARDSTSVGGWYGLAAVLSRSRRFAESRDALEHVLRLKPGDPDATRMIAYVTDQDARQRAGLTPQVAPAAPGLLKP
jgi:tetratricopeptide (TPR) repeat protein